MATNDPQLSFDPPRSPFGAWLGVVLLFAFFGLVAWVVIGAMPRGDRYEETRAQARVEKAKTVYEEEQASLSGYAWVDKEKGVARIPITRAMELTVAELAQKKPEPAGPIAPDPGPAAPPPAAPGPEAGPQTAAPPAPSIAPTAAPTPSPPDAKEENARHGPGSVIGGQPTGAANPSDAPAGTQPGPNATPAASPGVPSEQPPAPPGQRGPTPVQSPPGTPLPVRGGTPQPSP